jgi:hypothetical protein
MHAFCALSFDPFALNPSEQPRHRLLQNRHVLREQKEFERQRQVRAPAEAENAAGIRNRASGFARSDCSLRSRLTRTWPGWRRFALELGKMAVDLDLMWFAHEKSLRVPERC